MPLFLHYLIFLHHYSWGFKVAVIKDGMRGFNIWRNWDFAEVDQFPILLFLFLYFCKIPLNSDSGHVSCISLISLAIIHYSSRKGNGTAPVNNQEAAENISVWPGWSIKRLLSFNWVFNELPFQCSSAEQSRTPLTGCLEVHSCSCVHAEDICIKADEMAKMKRNADSRSSASLL